MRNFYKALFKNPRAIGSILPSSKTLAKKIASFIPEKTDLVIELGPGTGVITHAILQAGIAHHQLVTIENNQDLAALLNDRFPQIEIILGNADHLSTLIAHRKGILKTIISSLPLLSLPHKEKNQIIEEIKKVLTPKGYYIQYTYGTQKPIVESLSGFKKINSAQVWLNLPPAKIDVFEFSSKNDIS